MIFTWLACFLAATLSGAAPDQAAGDTNMRVKLFLCGDLMTGRGIDQALPHSVDPTLYESYVKDARRYVEIAELANGPLPDTLAFDYVWAMRWPSSNGWRPTSASSISKRP